jgi:hypothetical protein
MEEGEREVGRRGRMEWEIDKGREVRREREGGDIERRIRGERGREKEDGKNMRKGKKEGSDRGGEIQGRERGRGGESGGERWGGKREREIGIEGESGRGGNREREGGGRMIGFINTCESCNYLTLQHIINVLHYLPRWDDKWKERGDRCYQKNR